MTGEAAMEATRRRILIAAIKNPTHTRKSWATAAGVSQRVSERYWAEPEFAQWVQDRLILKLGDKVYKLFHKILAEAIKPKATVAQQQLAVSIVEKFKLTGLTDGAQKRANTQILISFTNPGGGAITLPPEPRAEGEAKMIELKVDDESFEGFEADDPE